MLCYIINIIKINKEGKLIKDYSKINSMWDVLVNDIDEVADKTRFTQLEKDSTGKEHHVGHLILLGSIRDRLEYPELRSTAQESFEDHQPDLIV